MNVCLLQFQNHHRPSSSAFSYRHHYHHDRHFQITESCKKPTKIMQRSSIYLQGNNLDSTKRTPLCITHCLLVASRTITPLQPLRIPVPKNFMVIIILVPWHAITLITLRAHDLQFQAAGIPNEFFLLFLPHCLLQNLAVLPLWLPV